MSPVRGNDDKIDFLLLKYSNNKVCWIITLLELLLIWLLRMFKLLPRRKETVCLLLEEKTSVLYEHFIDI